MFLQSFPLFCRVFVYFRLQLERRLHTFQSRLHLLQCQILSTAFGTALYGLLIDRGYSIEQIATVSATYISIALIFLFFIRNKLNPTKI